jgi:branched-chain amino acid transport system substrate-binding protein
MTVTISAPQGKTIIAAILLAIGISGPASSADTTGVTDKTIKIGLPGPFTGNASSYSKSQIGMHAYFNSVNDAGGINGRKLEIVEVDDACSETKGIVAIKNLIYEQKVFLINGVSCSGVGVAIKPMVLEAKIPFVISQAVNQNISEPVTPYIFHGVPTSYDAGASIVDFLLSNPAIKKIALVSHSNEWGQSYKNPQLEHMKKKYSMMPILDLAMERGSTDATPQVLQIRSSGADAVIVNLYEAETAIFLRDAAKYGLKIPMMGGYATDLENTLKRVANIEPVKNYFVLHMFAGSLDSPIMAKWGNMIKKYYPNEELTGFSFVGIGSAIATVEAIKRAGQNLTRERFIEEMDNLRNFKTGILAGDVTFTPQDHQGVKTSAIAGFVDGKPTLFTSWGKRLVQFSN